MEAVAWQALMLPLMGAMLVLGKAQVGGRRGTGTGRGAKGRIVRLPMKPRGGQAVRRALASQQPRPPLRMKACEGGVLESEEETCAMWHRRVYFAGAVRAPRGPEYMPI